MKIKESEGTREQVARSILENGPSTAAALGERLGITPAGIRRHLDTLIADGYLEARGSVYSIYVDGIFRISKTM